VQAYKAERHARIAVAFTRMSAAVEEMKTAGLPGNEAARLRQYNSLLLGQWETVRNVKRYRTSMTTRCFGRVYILLHPFIMGPYCAQAEAWRALHHAHALRSHCFLCADAYIAGVDASREHTNFGAYALALPASCALCSM
jgi:hypothetical protein